MHVIEFEVKSFTIDFVLEDSYPDREKLFCYHGTRNCATHNYDSFLSVIKYIGTTVGYLLIPAIF